MFLPFNSSFPGTFQKQFTSTKFIIAYITQLELMMYIKKDQQLDKFYLNTLAINI